MMAEASALPRRLLRTQRQRNIVNGLLFAAPWILGLLLFYVYPIFSSLYYSFCDYSILQAPKWAGIRNYLTLFTNDEKFIKSIYNTLYYAFFALPLGLVWGVSIALLLNMKVKGVSVYRTIYFLPVLVPDVALGILWLWVFNPQLGILNALLWKWFHIVGPGWLSDPAWAKPSVIIISLWGVGQAVVIYLAGLQDVPQELYDAAEVDGANAWQRIRNVTIPMITPVILFNLIIGLIGAFQYFTTAYVITTGDGRPALSLMFYAMYLYQNAFVLYKMGYASAMAWLLFLAAVISSYALFRSSARWVYYGGQ